MELNELREELVTLIPDYTKVEALVSGIFKTYKIENTITSFRILYGYLLTFSFFEREKASEIFKNLIADNSTLELSMLARTIHGDDVVEFYEKMLEIEHLTSLHPIINQFESSFNDLSELINDSEESFAHISDLLKEIK